MAWFDNIRNLFNPKPAAGGLPISTVPAIGVANTLTGGAAKTTGNLVELLSDVGNTTDCWATGMYVYNANQATQQYYICLSREVAGGPPAVKEIEVPVFTQTTVVADGHEFFPFPTKVYFPAGTGIRAAVADVAGGKTIQVNVVIQRGLG